MKKRIEHRHNCEGSISCRYFIKGETFNGRMLNFSKSGMYFESGECIREGETIYFRLISSSSLPSAREFFDGLRSESLAEVKWCREIKNEDAAYFGYGVKYY